MGRKKTSVTGTRANKQKTAKFASLGKTTNSSCSLPKCDNIDQPAAFYAQGPATEEHRSERRYSRTNLDRQQPERRIGTAEHVGIERDSDWVDLADGEDFKEDEQGFALDNDEFVLL